MLIAKLEVDLTTANVSLRSQDLREIDDLYYVFVRGDPGGSFTGTLTFQHQVELGGQKFATDPVTTLALDETHNHIDVERYAYGDFVVGTAQSGARGTLFLYGRQRAGIDGGSP